MVLYRTLQHALVFFKITAEIF